MSTPRWAGRAALAPLVTVACAQPAQVTQGEALVFADTDLTVPALANRLRVDIYSADSSVWIASHDVDRSTAADWPASFAVDLADGVGEQTVLVRLRAYAAGNVRDYRGERFLARPMGSTSLDVPSPSTPLATSDCPECPRLYDAQGADITPAQEPLPALAVDRLLAVDVRPGARGSARVVLRGACVGTMADLYGARSCVDTDGVLVDVEPEALSPDAAVPAGSAQGTFEQPYATGCAQAPRAAGSAPDGTPLHDDQVCVPGGVFALGSFDGFGYGAADDFPQRVVALSPFLMDRYEVTVARWRDAVARGFANPDSATPYSNDGPIPTRDVSDESDPSICAWSTSPRPASEDREEYGISCVSWKAARAFCRFEDGDLPTEAQWEYAAAVAGRAYRTRYAWGGADGVDPPCDRAVFARGSLSLTDDGCNTDGMHFGPLPVAAADRDGGDRSAGLGIVGLGGGLQEWTRDALAPLDSSCWLGAPLLDPACEPADVSQRTVRGGAWFSPDTGLVSSARDGAAPSAAEPTLGFRCVRGGS